MGFMEKIFGDINTKEVKKIEKTADQVMALDSQMAAMSDEELKGKTAEFKERLAAGETLDDILVEAFAVCREAAARSVGMKHFKVQVIGGIALHQGRIAEMKTGEGKTLVATLPAYLNALEGKGVHIVTVNDYLAKRDAEWMGKIYTFLGLTVGCVIHGISDKTRKAAYQADITYGTNNEFGFDYLRDNMVIYKSQLTQRDLNYAIIDEVDSILIDEARTPLIISGQGDESTDLYQIADRFVKTLKEEDDFTIEEKEKRVSLTDAGVAKAEKFFNIENFGDPENMEINHHVLEALKARAIMKRDVDYIVKDGEIVIVDEFTGRLMFGRRYSNGLHQAIEAKEGVLVRSESKTLATITLQNYFRMYNKLAGMTGTAKTEEEEFRDIYNMDVVVIPTNKPIIREDLDDAIFAKEEYKFKAITDRIAEAHETGQPVLVGTISIENSERLSNLLKKRGIKHNVLNAKQHEKEAEIVAEAGRLGAVTIATNMAGRGTDIILGGNPEFEAKREMKLLEYTDEQISFATSFVSSDDPEMLKAREKFNELLAKYKEERAGEQEKVRELGGLCIIGTERHESRRIDNQLRGRSGRQGDPGFSQFCVSFEDDLMVRFGTDRAKGLLQSIGFDDDMAIRNKMLSSSIEQAQKRVEGSNYDIRKTLLEYDDVINQQREIIYEKRNTILDSDSIHDLVIESMDNFFYDLVNSHVAPEGMLTDNDIDEILEFVNNQLLRGNINKDEVVNMTNDEMVSYLLKRVTDEIDERTKELPDEIKNEFEKAISLRVIDTLWMEHINSMSILREGIHLRGYANENPLRAYTTEGFELFDNLLYNIDKDITTFIARAEVKQNVEREQVAKPVETNDGSKVRKKQPKRVNKIGRNDQCPCGSGKKYKQCCGK